MNQEPGTRNLELPSLLEGLVERNGGRILMIVADGLGGLANETGRSEMETARRPNLDELARVSALGQTDPVGIGITSGSGPAHLALFGYDPIEHQVGRGVLEALGIGLELTRRDLCIRTNFCTVDKSTGVITDRRAGRIATEKNQALVARIQAGVTKIEDVEVMVRPGMGHRAVVVLRGDGLSDRLSESDPQKEGRKPVPIEALSADAEKSTRVVNEFLRIVAEVIKNEPAANYMLMRGFSKIPHLESMQERYGLEPACIAAYPMYRGLASLLGMTILPTEGGWDGEIETLEQDVRAGEVAAAQELKSSTDSTAAQDLKSSSESVAAQELRSSSDLAGPYTFFYLHFKDLDRLGEDGNFAGKVEWIEKLDGLIPRIRKMGFDVIVLTGDHSTPAVLKGHSWHPNPFLLWSRYVRRDGIAEFTERACARGALGRMPSTAVMPLVLANALRLKKYGA